jgi:uncharacterized protein YigA (DUF484 family)
VKKLLENIEFIYESELETARSKYPKVDEVLKTLVTEAVEAENSNTEIIDKVKYLLSHPSVDTQLQPVESTEDGRFQRFTGLDSLPSSLHE